MKRAATSLDWSAMIDELVRLGITPKAIGDAMHCMLTDRMIAHYRRGVQPLHWRGELLVEFWASKTGTPRTSAPRCEIVRGHRAEHHSDAGPRLQHLPAWPVAVPVAVAPLRKKPGPKPRARAVA